MSLIGDQVIIAPSILGVPMEDNVVIVGPELEASFVDFYDDNNQQEGNFRYDVDLDADSFSVTFTNNGSANGRRSDFISLRNLDWVDMPDAILTDVVSTQGDARVLRVTDSFNGNGESFVFLQFRPSYTAGTSITYSFDIVTDPVCFLPGTKILTDKGQVAVEDLILGDMVKTADGSLEPIKWIGKQTVNPSQIKNPLRGNPILIKAGALGNGLPVRDLYTSPDHAYLFEGLLINAGALVNNVSVIKTEPTETFYYYHVELANHSLLLAEGTPAESFYPNHEDRLTFDNGAEYDRLYPDGNSKLMLYPLDYPRVSSTNKVPRYVRQKLTAIAEELNPSKVLATV